MADDNKPFKFSPWGSPQPAARASISVSGDEVTNMADGCKDGESCAFAKSMEIQFLQLTDSSRHSARRLSDVNDFISEQSQINHLQEGTKVGTREAAAMQRMDQDKSSNKAMEMATAVAASGK